MPNVTRLVKWMLLALALLLVDLEASALPADPPPAPTVLAASDGPQLLAQRRKRRPKGRAPNKRRPAPRKQQPVDPAPEAADPDDVTPAAAAPAASVDADTLRRGGRVEFDGRLVQGQTAKSGAIYLFARQRTDLKSMVKERTDFRTEILRTVSPNWAKSR